MRQFLGCRIAAAVALFGVLGEALDWAVGSPIDCARSALLNPPARFDDLLVAVAGACAWLCLLWFAAVVVLQVFTLGGGLVARRCRALACRVSPQPMLGAARWLVGVSLLAGPLVSGVAVAQPVGGSAPAPARPSSTAAMLSLDRPHSIGLDRPVASDDVPQPSTPPQSSTPTPASAPTPTRRAAAASSPMPIAATHAQARSAAASTYVVRAGDTLWGIAAHHLGPRATNTEIANAWPRWYAANRDVIGASPRLIFPGQLLHAPDR